MNEKLDAEAFSRIVLWNLAVLRSQMAALQSEMFSQIQTRTEKPMDEIVQPLTKQIDLEAERLFQESRKAAGLADFPKPNRN